jgi:sn-glycerol 3-phosphate transport system substrate-binding protein
MLTNLHYQRRLYALPINRSVPVLYYNKDRFAEAGLDPDKPPQTWQEVRDLSETLTHSKGRGRYGFLVQARAWTFESLVTSAGGELLAGGKAAFAQPAAKPLQLLADMVHRDKTARFGTASDVYSQFFSGNVAMVIESTAVLQMFTANSGFKVGTAPVPRFEGFKNAVPTGGGAAVIPAANSAERKAATWEFLTWLIATKQAAAWSRNTGYLPVRESARALLEKDGFYREHAAFETAIKELAFARESPPLPQWDGAVSKIIENAMTAVVRYNAPALETLKSAEHDVDGLLKSPRSGPRKAAP